MNAIDTLTDYYHNRGGVTEWNRDQWLYARHGVCYLSPDLCLLMRPVISTWSNDDIIQDRVCGLTDTPNMWHIHLAIGNLSNSARLAPFHLPLISFQRLGGKLKTYNLKTLIHHGIISKHTKEASTDNTSSRD